MRLPLAFLLSSIVCFEANGQTDHLTLVKNGDADEEGIKALMADYADKGIISRYGIPDRVIFVDELPRTSVGKLDKKKMRAEMV